MILQHPVQRRINTLCVQAQVAEVFAKKGKLCFLRIYSLYAADLLHRLWLEDIAAHPVDGICGVNDDAAVQHALCKLLYEPWLGVIGMYL